MIHIPPAQGFHLAVSGGHRLWVETYGTPAGYPILFLHGGPGSGCNPSQRALFDPDYHFAIFLDQRGAGKSLPAGERAANTTADLIADIEILRQHLGIAQWLVTGGSWGATLALAYAQAHPQAVTGLALRAVFLGTKAELHRAFITHLECFFPLLWQGFIDHLDPAERANPLAAYYRRILDPDPAVHGPAAWIWHDINRALGQTPAPLDRLVDHADAPLPRTPFMEAHYFSHDCFMPDGALLAGAGSLADIPGVIVQGRHDLLCPPANAFALQARWPKAEVAWVEGAGHALSHPPVMAALRDAIWRLGAH